MSNIFDIAHLSGAIAIAKDKAIAAAAVYNITDIVAGHVLPPLPPFPNGSRIGIEQSAYENIDLIAQEDEGQTRFTLFGTPMCFPLRIKLKSEKDWWLIPVEPIITIGGTNTIAKRKVSKGTLRGTIKERWSQDDYTISIESLLTRFDEWRYPTDDVKRLQQYCEAREPVEVECQLFEIFSINRIVIESFDFPFTKGEENQAYRISASSDDDWELFIDKNKKGQHVL